MKKDETFTYSDTLGNQAAVAEASLNYAGRFSQQERPEVIAERKSLENTVTDFSRRANTEGID